MRPWGGCARCTLAAMLMPDCGEEESAGAAGPAAFGDYELLEEIARGGAGVVWRARQRGLGRVVALKILRESTLPGEEAARRFRFEGETVARLRHPHIVTVHEIGEAGGRWFMSMDLMAGGTLAERLKRGLLSARESARLLVKVARAVQHAHEHGVIHRDLKPGNILLDAAGEPHVADFGLARDAGDDMEITATGVILGTPAYMSPEQASGLSRGLTTATDVYALGAILYEMLTGGPVFRGDSHIEVLRRTREEDPVSPAKAVSALDRDIATICLKCLEKNPNARYPGAGALADDLERWLRSEPIVARTSTMPERLWKWMRRHPAKAALGATTAAAFAAVTVVSTVFSVKVERQRVATLHRVAQQHTQRALHFMENGDAFRGLLPLAEAIDIGSGDATADRMNRMRFASIMRLSPQLTGLWILPPETPLRVQFPTAGQAVLLTYGRTARLENGPLMEHAADITGADLNEDGTRIVCGTADGRWTLWDGQSGRQIANGPGSVRAFAPLTACHMDGTIAGDRFVVTEGNVVRQFRVADGAPAAPEMKLDQPVRWAAITPDARKLFVFTEGGLIITASADLPDSRIRSGKTTADLVLHSMTKMPDQGYFSFCDREGQTYGLIGWEYSHPQTIAPRHDPMMFPVPAPLLAVGWSVSGQSHFLTGGKLGATLRSPWVYIDPDKYQLGTTFPQGTRTVAASFEEGGRIAATLAVNGAAQLWDVPAEGRMGPRLWSIGKPLDARLSRDGKALLVRTSATAAWLWKWPAHDGAAQAFTAADWTSEQESASFPATPHAASATSSSSRGITATIVDSQSVLLADAATGRSISPPVIHPEPVNAVSLSPDGRLLCTVWGNRYARVWETGTGQPVTTQFDHPALTTLAWYRDSQSLATTGASGEVRIWDLTPAPQTPAALKTLARLLSAHRLLPGSESGLIPLSSEELRGSWDAAGSGAR